MSESQLSQKIDDFAKQMTEIEDARKRSNTEKFDKLADASAQTLDDINNLKAQKSSQDKVIKELEVKIESMKGNLAIAPNDAKGMGEYQTELVRYLKKGKIPSYEVIEKSILEYMAPNTKYFLPEERAKFSKDLVEGINPQGGYWIIPDRSSSEVTRIFESSPMRDLCTVTTSSNDVLELIIDDNQFTTGGWVGETESRSTTATAEIGLLQIPIQEQYAQPIATQRLLDDAPFDIMSWINTKTLDVMSREENTQFVTGDGVKKPNGILNYDYWAAQGTYERGKLEQYFTGVDGDLTYSTLVDLQNAQVEGYQPNSLWLMNRTTWALVLKLLDTQDRPLFQLQNLLQTGADKILLGKRVVFASDVPVAATDSNSIIYGDFRTGYTIVDRIGFRVLRDEYTQKPYTLFYTTKRVGGAVTNYQCLKILTFGSA